MEKVSGLRSNQQQNFQLTKQRNKTYMEGQLRNLPPVILLNVKFMHELKKSKSIVQMKLMDL